MPKRRSQQSQISTAFITPLADSKAAIIRTEPSGHIRLTLRTGMTTSTNTPKEKFIVPVLRALAYPKPTPKKSTKVGQNHKLNFLVLAQPITEKVKIINHLKSVRSKRWILQLNKNSIHKISILYCYPINKL